MDEQLAIYLVRKEWVGRQVELWDNPPSPSPFGSHNYLHVMKSNLPMARFLVARKPWVEALRGAR